MNLHIIYRYLFVFAFAFLFSCNAEEHSDIKDDFNIELSENNISKTTLSVPNKESVEFVKKPCVCFFSMSDKEYENYLISSNINVKWEFDVVYKKFKRDSKSAISSLKQNNIYSVYTTKPIIAFISEKNDTVLFKRKDEDYFIGQIFYSGNDTLIVEEGLMKINLLEEKIKSFFKVNNDFRIKAVYEKVDSSKSELKDTSETLLPDTVM